jgi:hypothetical protein
MELIHDCRSRPRIGKNGIKKYGFFPLLFSQKNNEKRRRETRSSSFHDCALARDCSRILKARVYSTMCLCRLLSSLPYYSSRSSNSKLKIDAEIKMAVPPVHKNSHSYTKVFSSPPLLLSSQNNDIHLSCLLPRAFVPPQREEKYNSLPPSSTPSLLFYISSHIQIALRRGYDAKTVDDGNDVSPLLFVPRHQTRLTTRFMSHHLHPSLFPNHNRIASLKHPCPRSHPTPPYCTKRNQSRQGSQ